LAPLPGIVIRREDRFAVEQPSDVLARFGLVEGTQITIQIDEEHGGILIAPVPPAGAGIEPEFGAVVAGFVERYRPALGALAQRQAVDLPAQLRQPG
jgi:hypothetical protein